jgi:hypothetical protein
VAQTGRKESAANTFKSVALKWFAAQEDWVSNHADRVKRLLERDLFPLLGDRPLADIEEPELL